MANNIVQLQDKSGDNIYPISGGTVQGAVTKGMLAEGVFEGPELSEPTDVAYVRTANIVDGAVTTNKIADSVVTHDKVALGVIYGDANGATSVTTGNLAMKTVGTGNLRDGAVTKAKLGSNVVIPTITMTTTDPGEGATLAANSFIGVYS